MVRQRDDGDLNRYYDELDRLKAEKLQQKALARERRGTLYQVLERIFIFGSVIITLPLWIVIGSIRWMMGRDSLAEILRRNYSENFMASAIVGGIVAWLVTIIASTIIYVHTTRTFCEQNRMNLACIQQDIDHQQADLDKLRSEQDK